MKAKLHNISYQGNFVDALSVGVRGMAILFTLFIAIHSVPVCLDQTRLFGKPRLHGNCVVHGPFPANPTVGYKLRMARGVLLDSLLCVIAIAPRKYLCSNKVVYYSALCFSAIPTLITIYGVISSLFGKTPEGWTEGSTIITIVGLALAGSFILSLPLSLVLDRYRMRRRCEGVGSGEPL